MAACNGGSFTQAEGFEYVINLLLRCVQGWNHGQTIDRFEQAHAMHGPFYGDGIRFHKVDLHQRQIAALERAGGGEIAVIGGADELRHRAGDFVRDYGDEAASAERDERNSEGVIAREDGESFRKLMRHVRNLRDVAGGFFHARNGGDLREAREGGGFDVDAGAPLDVIDDDGNADGFSDRLVMLVEALL